VIFPWDSETFPIKPGRQAPRVVCVQTREGGIELREPGLDRIERALAGDCIFVGHRIAYDVICSIASRPRLARPWLAAYKADRVTCTMEREKLIRIADGSIARWPKPPSLEDLVLRYEIPNPYDPGVKGGPVRTGYHAWDGVDPALWPENFRAYALADLVVGDVYEAQASRVARLGRPGWLADEFRQARAALWLATVQAHGMMVDRESAEVLAEVIEAEHHEVRDLLTYADADRVRYYAEARGLEVPPELPAPFPLVRPTGKRDTKAAKRRMLDVCAALQLPIQITKTGKEKRANGETIDPANYVALDVDACAATLDPVLMAYARFGSIGTLRARVARLTLASSLGLPIQPSFDTLKETGRTSSTAGGKIKPGVPMMSIGDQSQNLPREPGLRECYVARPGCLILSSDWKAAELHALAQACLDLGLDSYLARLLNEGKDVHLWFACIMRGWSYEWATSKARTPDEKKQIKDARQAAKACMFGFPGGLGIEKFRLFAAKQYQVRLTEAQAKELKGLWLSALPEMIGYFAHVTRLIDSGAPLVHFLSGRYRGALRYTSAANSYFQGRVADMIKDAGFRILDLTLSGQLLARQWNEAHDEILIEFPRTDTQTPAIVTGIMDAVGRDWCPGCPAKAEPALQIHWRKGAEPAYRDGILIPHEEREISFADPKFRAATKKVLDSPITAIQKSWKIGVEVSRLPELRQSIEQHEREAA
jgi:hypothetical protein